MIDSGNNNARIVRTCRDYVSPSRTRMVVEKLPLSLRVGSFLLPTEKTRSDLVLTMNSPGSPSSVSSFTVHSKPLVNALPVGQHSVTSNRGIGRRQPADRQTRDNTIAAVANDRLVVGHMIKTTAAMFVKLPPPTVRFQYQSSTDKLLLNCY